MEILMKSVMLMVTALGAWEPTIWEACELEDCNAIAVEKGVEMPYEGVLFTPLLAVAVAYQSNKCENTITVGLDAAVEMETSYKQVIDRMKKERKELKQEASKQRELKNTLMWAFFVTGALLAFVLVRR